MIKANLSYAISGLNSTFDAFSLETSINQKQTTISDMIKLSLKSGTNAEKYDAEIARLYSEISVLRQQLKQAQQRIQDNAQYDGDIQRAMQWLEENQMTFDKYDDITIRRLVDTIKVNKDDTIAVSIKGGIEISVTINKS